MDRQRQLSGPAATTIIKIKRKPAPVSSSLKTSSSTVVLDSDLDHTNPQPSSPIAACAVPSSTSTLGSPHQKGSSTSGSADDATAKLSTEFAGVPVTAASPVTNETGGNNAPSKENSPSSTRASRPVGGPPGAAGNEFRVPGPASNYEKKASNTGSNHSSRDIKASASSASVQMSSPSPAVAAAHSADVANDPGRPQQHQDGAANGDTPRKGGHSLRKRARVDYTSEHIDESPTVPNSSLRGKRRKVGISDDFDDGGTPTHTHNKRRGTSLGAESHHSPIARRRHASRKSLDLPSYMETPEEDQGTIQDTIEVGGISFPDIHDSDPEYDEYEPQQLEDAATQTGPGPQPETLDSNINSYEEYYEEQPRNAQYAWIEGQNPDGSYQMPVNEGMSNDNMYPVDPNFQLQEESYEAQSRQPSVAQQTQEYYQDSPQPLDPALFSEAGFPRKSATPKVEATNPQPARLSGDGTNNTSSSNVPTQKEEHVQAVLQDTLKSPQPQTSQPVTATEVQEDLPATDVAPPHPSQQDKPEEPKPPSPLPSTHSELLKDAHDRAVVTDAAQVKVKSPASAEITTEPTKHASPAQESAPVLAAVTRSAKKQQSAKPSGSTGEALEDLKDQADETASKSSSGKSTSAIPGLELAFAKSHFLRPQPKPKGRWSHLTPYLDGEYVTYPERRNDSEEVATEDQGVEEKDTDKDVAEPMIEDIEDGDGSAPTPLPMTPRGGSPILDAVDPATFNSPIAGVEYQDDPEASGSEEAQEHQKYYSFRKARDPEELLTALQNTEDLDRFELSELIGAVNVSMTAWRDEYLELQPLVDDDANAQRRRLADQKYETRTRDLNQHGVNWEEPEFQLKGYQVKKREPMTDNRYLQEQDRIMAAAYGFPYDNHPSKIGKQNPESRTSGGIMTRGRTLRNQPKQTAKATEADEVVGKRQRKPVQPFEALNNLEMSRSSTPVPGLRGRRRRYPNPEADAVPPHVINSFTKDLNSDGEAAQTRGRRRQARADPALEDQDALQGPGSSASQEQASPVKQGRRRGRIAIKPNDAAAPDMKLMDASSLPEPKPPTQPRHMVTLKVGRNVLENSQHLAGMMMEKRPSTSSSESSSHTAESSYSFRPKRQKRFRDEPEGDGPTSPQPPKKRARKAYLSNSASGLDGDVAASTEIATSEMYPKEHDRPRKTHKIKVIRNAASTPVSAVAPTPHSRTGTPASLPTSTGDGDETPKDYRSMTKSEKMSASMKSRWANGNMAGAVEKRKATLAAKKAAQAAAEQKVGPLAPKPKKGKKDKDNASSTSSTTPQPQPLNLQGQQQYHVQPPIMHPAPHMPPQLHDGEQEVYIPHQYQPQYRQTNFVQQPLPPQVPQHHPHQHVVPPPPAPAPPSAHSQQHRTSSFMSGLPGIGYIYPSK